MKIFFVTSTLTSGGSERVMSILANELSDREHTISIICLNKNIVYYPISDNVKILFAEQETESRCILKKLLWLRNYVCNNVPDVVIPFMEAVYCATLFALLGIKIPVISSERVDPRKSPFLRNILRRIFLPLTTHLVVQTEDIKRFYPNFIRKRTTIIFNPVTDEVFSKSDNTPNKFFPKRIISVGKLDYQKNQQVMICAFAQLAEKYPNWSLYIYGEGPLRSRLEAIISKEKLENRCFLPGRSERVIDEMKRSEIFCFSSNFEGMSNAMIEAICVGLPIVTTNVSGVSELVEHGRNGYVVPCGDILAFTHALEKLMRDENVVKAMSDQNIKKSSMFKIDHIVNQWETLITNVVLQYKRN